MALKDDDATAVSAIESLFVQRNFSGAAVACAEVLAGWRLCGHSCSTRAGDCVCISVAAIALQAAFEQGQAIPSLDSCWIQHDIPAVVAGLRALYTIQAGRPDAALQDLSAWFAQPATTPRVASDGCDVLRLAELVVHCGQQVQPPLPLNAQHDFVTHARHLTPSQRSDLHATIENCSQRNAPLLFPLSHNSAFVDADVDDVLPEYENCDAVARVARTAQPHQSCPTTARRLLRAALRWLAELSNAVARQGASVVSSTRRIPWFFLVLAIYVLKRALG